MTGGDARGRAGPEDDARSDAPRCAPEHHAFFLDLDGTLLEFASHPQAVHVDDELRALLAALAAASAGALAVVSGRSIADVDHLLEPARLPLAGQHGVERRDAAGCLHVHSSADPHALDALRASAQRWRQAHPGLLIEDKGLSMALHYRLAPDLAETLGPLVHAQVAGAGDVFHVLAGKMVLEVKPSGRDKGKAIRDFMTERPFAGRTPVFIGDDTTDEYGFAAVNALGGVSIKVGRGESEAHWRLADVGAVWRWLRDAVAAGDPRRSASAGDCS